MTEESFYQFGEFSLDARSGGALRKHGKLLAISPSACGVLRCLVQHRERAVTRKELFHAGWPGTRVTDGSLTQAIWELRKVLQRSSSAAEIQTVRGVGYRFFVEGAARAISPSETQADEFAFVARKTELERMRSALQAAREGIGRICLVTGPAAIGKSRIATELIADSARAGWALLSANALPQTDCPACWPWLQMLGRHLDGAAPSLIERCLQMAPQATQLVPGLRTHGNLLQRQERQHTQQAYLLEELARMFMLVTDEAPTILWLDDLHWADDASISLLPMLAHALRRRPVLVLLTCRSQGRPQLVQAVSELTREYPHERVDLRGLQSEDIAPVLEQHCTEPVPVAAQVVALSAGLPLLALQVARLIGRTGKGSLPGVDEVGYLELVDLVAERLHTLAADELSTLQAASILEPEFRGADLGALTDRAPHQVLQHLERLEHDAYLREVAVRSGRFVFCHAALRAAAYQSLSRSQRLTLHRKAAERIESSGVDHVSARLLEIARHYALAAEDGCAEKAWHYALRAANRACAGARYGDAVAHYRQALSAHDLGERHEPELRLQILFALGEVMAAAAFPVDEVRAVFREAAGRASALRLHGEYARAALAYAGQHAIGFMPMRTDGTVDTGEVTLLESALAHGEHLSVSMRALVLATLAFALACTPQRARRDALLREALLLARSEPSPWLLARTLLTRIYASTAPDQLSEQLASCDELVLLAEQLGSRGLSLTARLLRMMCSLQTADLTAARADSALAMRYAQQLESPAERQRAGVLDLLTAFWEGRIADAERLSLLAFDAAPDDPNQRLLFGLRMGQIWQAKHGLDERTLEIARSTAAAYPSNEGWLAAVAWVAAVTGADDTARAHFDLAARDAFANLPEDHSWLACMQLLGDAAVRLSDAARAQLIFARLERYADRLVFHGWCGTPSEAIAATLGRLASVLGRTDEARRCFDRARAMYRNLGARLFEAALDLAEAQALLRVGRAAEREQAAPLLARAAEFADAQGVRWLSQDVMRVRLRFGLASVPAACSVREVQA